MKEIRYWEAEDGTRFDYEDECQEYEEKQLFIEMLKVIPCYDAGYARITGEDDSQASYNNDTIHYISIPDNADDNFFETLRNFNDAYFYGHLPCEETKPNNDLIYFDEESDTWRVWSKDIASLEIFSSYFQLFRKGE